MVEAIQVRCRYDTKDEKGETRRERNERFGKGEENPPFYSELIPDAGRHVWNWYYALSSTLLRVRDGITLPIPPSEFRAWVKNTGHIVYPSEYAIMCAMDEAFCEETAKEVKAFQERSRSAPPEAPQPRTRQRRNGK